jgi:hypothetical protein
MELSPKEHERVGQGALRWEPDPSSRSKIDPQRLPCFRTEAVKLDNRERPRLLVSQKWRVRENCRKQGQ